MQVQITVGDLSSRQWNLLQETLPTRHDMAPGVLRMCVVFGLDATTERHAEMPVRAFAGLMTRLQRVEAHAEMAETALTPDALPDTESGQDPLPGYPDKADDPGPARNDCAFCLRERNAKDDNHADDCPYWSVGPGSLR